MRLADVIADAGHRAPAAIAVIDGVRVLTYRELLLCCDEGCRFLKSLGVGAGVVVAVALNNSIEYLVALFSIAQCGACALLLGEDMGEEEILRLTAKCRASIIVTSGSKASQLGTVAGSTVCPCLCSIRIDHAAPVFRRSGGSPMVKDEAVSNVAIMIPTSGTSGYAKIAMLLEQSLLVNLAAYRLALNLHGRHIAYVALPMKHVYCLNAQVLAHLSRADTLILGQRPFLVERFVEATEQCGVTCTAFVPHLLEMVATYQRPLEVALKGLEYIIVSGDKMSRTVFDAFHARLPWVEVIPSYGMTEAGPRIAVAAPRCRPYPMDSVGHALPGVEIRIAGETGTTLGAGEVGEICVRGGGLMKGYYAEPEKTAEVISGGWLRTGDLGYCDDAGSLYITGRMKEIIISGGTTMHPCEIEDKLLECRGVAEAAVVGREHRTLGHVPWAFVVKDSTSRVVSAGDIMRQLRTRLSADKQPYRIMFVNSLPRNSVGKVDRRALTNNAKGANADMA